MTRSCCRPIVACWMRSAGIQSRLAPSWTSPQCAGMPLDATAIERLCGLALGGLIHTALGVAAADEDIDQAERTEAVEDILTAVRTAPTPPGWDQTEWAAFTGTLIPHVVEPARRSPGYG